MRRGIVGCIGLLVLLGGNVRAEEIALARDGKALLPVLAGKDAGPAERLASYLGRISGGTFAVEPAAQNKAGILVGTAADFPWLALDDAEALGEEGFEIRTAGGSLRLLAPKPAGVRHAVTTLLRDLGCRWFFPGKTWEVVPERRTIAGGWNLRQGPDFTTQRRIWYGYGSYPKGRDDWEAWVRDNRMAERIRVSIGHTWHGLDPVKDFAAHPDWFALVDGKRQPTKPCYSHPEVARRASAYAVARAATGLPMISMSPPDGLGYCACDRCRAVFLGGEPYASHGSLYAKRPDGTVVCITSETLFAFVNTVAAAVAELHPGTFIGCYAYSAYSHPPSFPLHPNVYLQTTTAYRRTPLSMAEQLKAFGDRTRHLGVREYYSVYQWDWDYPSVDRVAPHRLRETLRDFHRHGVTAVNAEASNNWGPRGLGYYVAAQLMWDVEADVDALVRDFYERAFGPARFAMQRYYARWYGPEVAVLEDGGEAPPRAKYVEKKRHHLDVLKAAYADLDEAGRLAKDAPAILARLDHLRMYLHYLFLRSRLEAAARTKDEAQILAAIREETVFGGRLTDTHMIHARPLLGKAFLRRFKPFAALLEKHPETKAWRKVGEPPGREELETLWKADKKAMGMH